MSIYNFFQYSPALASGAQPTPEQIQALKAEGYEAVVNISPISARNALINEANLVEQLQMDYVHFPIDCSNLRPLHFNTFRGIMNGLEGKKTFVHCGGNIKSSNLLHMYHVIEKGIDEKQSLQTLLKIQKPEAKWFAYFKAMGMQGIAY
jgi:protein tyrosine phosphatase (PTP) superfamily phosphohydrolase (DUF442 family)